jgi:hypothetical protein
MDLFLHVNIRVPKRNAEGAGGADSSFPSLMTDFLRGGTLKRRGWDLQAGLLVREQLEVASSFNLQTALAPDEAQFVNLWRLPKDFHEGDIASVMLELSETPVYVKLDGLVSAEQQEIVSLVNAPAAVDKKRAGALDRARSGGGFIRIRHYVDRKNLSSFVFNSGAIAPVWSKEKSWEFLGTFQNITGVLNEFWEIWHIPKLVSRAEVEADLIELLDREDSVTKELARSIEYQQKKPNSPTHDGLAVLSAASYW